jgi:hypothetical protein
MGRIGKSGVRGGYAYGRERPAVSTKHPNARQHNETLVAEEHALFDKGSALSTDDRRRLNEVNVQLDRLWDLLR